MKIHLSDNRSVEGSDLKEIPLKDWLAEGEQLFGADRKKWKWKCANCGHVQSMADFIRLREKKISDVDPSTAYFSCIGRFDSRIPEKDVGTVFDKKSPCNYTNGGLFCFANIFVINEFGDRIPVFEFAKEDKSVG
jgi:hypothetical protein